jgi:hypothetical protein
MPEKANVDALNFDHKTQKKSCFSTRAADGQLA